MLNMLSTLNMKSLQLSLALLAGLILLGAAPARANHRHHSSRTHHYRTAMHHYSFAPRLHVSIGNHDYHVGLSFRLRQRRHYATHSHHSYDSHRYATQRHTHRYTSRHAYRSGAYARRNVRDHHRDHHDYRRDRDTSHHGH